ncbi:hydratase (plasmid) [Rhizobium sp. TRM96647]|uniref:carbon-nitrogen hydrolase family protein n=1 Tax=unclassified Rhizobium TaxID=2613769 RepID=UPI0021E92EC8|nr:MULTISPECIES: nitrilase-related carbon-nitrogen hydrolase [unclassified Rhizobium]MCV3735182.1 hydratase [Rhizobium sp. TRM96647]MCV3758055.1 hydratase [Rhizobium sp. TRM96650]
MTRVAAIQLTGGLYTPQENRAAARSAILEAVDTGARLIVLPELAISGYGADPQGLRQASEAVDGDTLADWTRIAARHKVWIAGGFCEREEDRLYNSAMLVGPEGLAGHYRKLHLFDAEKDVFTPGDKGLSVVDTDVGRIGMCVCYDLRFVEVVRALALQGADIVAVPTAWLGGFDPNPRDAMGFIGQARGAMVQANLNQVYMVCASQGGRVANLRFLGSSMIVDPFGEVLAGPLPEEDTRIVTAEINVDRLAAARVRSPRIRPREDRRTDVYEIRIGGNSY